MAKSQNASPRTVTKMKNIIFRRFTFIKKGKAQVIEYFLSKKRKHGNFYSGVTEAWPMG